MVAAVRKRRLVDLSHVVVDGMTTYPGLPAPRVGDHLTREKSRPRYAPGTEFHIGRIEMVGNTGTYLDAPSHRFADGVDIAGLPLESAADLPGIVVRFLDRPDAALSVEDLLPYDVAGKAVLIHTGWDRHWGDERYFDGHPHLSAEAARHLAARAALVGIDSLNVDGAADLTRPAHTALLGAGVPVVEHLRGLDQLPPTGFRFHAAPVAVASMGTFPVRAYAVLDSG
ncbi:MAG: cyclase family protein [Stackebrandtia sp.]